MKILVTGGCGFIGSNFIRHILNNCPDYKITNFDNLSYAGNLDNLKDIDNNPNYKFIKGDICDCAAVGRVLEGCSAIVNFAAQTHVDRSIVNAKDFIQTNVYGTYVLLEAARSLKIGRFVHISTDEVFGSIKEGSFNENSPLAPNSPYSASKAGADMLCRSYFVTYNLPVVVVRSSNNFGPYQYPEKVIPLFITNLLENKKVPLYGAGKNIRDWLFVEDNCRAIDLILHKGKEGEVYNVGGSKELANLELTELILRRMDKPKSFVNYVQDRLGHDYRYSLDCSKLKRLGWQVQRDFETALDWTIEWYKNNREWWKGIKSI